MSIFLSLGTNINNRKNNLEKARDCIQNSSHIKITKESPIYQTSPMHYKKQSNFLNQIIEIETNLRPINLLKEMQSIEKLMGRDRLNENKYQERTIDIDVLCYNEIVLNHKEITIPHPEIENRKFILKPWSDICPHYVLPNSEMNIYDLYKKISHLEDTVELFNL